MPFDDKTRNKLSRLVGDARRLLVTEFTEQLQELYGIQPDGAMVDLDALTHLDDEQLATASRLRERITHLASGFAGEKKPLVAGIDRALREQAFTILNRFAALRMCEERGLLQECVANGFNSKGFKVYLQVAGSGLGDTYHRYRTFIFILFDELAVDLGVLFDHFSPFGLLFPREQALLGLLELLNQQELKQVWSEDETIGWVYQYFNPPEERRAMREASSAPRNSRELAVRNQFFTPRYVVEFLSDNTLGRIWYEMTRGQTRLKDICRYLVRRPTEVFLDEGDISPNQESGTKNEELSQEEPSCQPVYIPHRPMKDPRTIRMLDPACGSMHFGLYCFDIYEVIYEEAWDIEEREGAQALAREPGMALLHDTFSSKEEFLRQVPRLIIEHNIHGIDIDPRCVQIAGLSLWLRAQKTWQKQGLRPLERPRITKSNIVCAEPMPGSKDLLRDFTATLPHKAIGQLVEMIFDKMQLAGEAGSLLKIEEEIRGIVVDAKTQWKAGPKAEQGLLFSESVKPKQAELQIDTSGVSDEQFWEKAEENIYKALAQYAESVQSGRVFSRRLFAEDAARGFAFIDVCRKRYDVVVMNPPFGETAKSSKAYLKEHFGHSFADIFQAFVERLLTMLTTGGREGVLSARTGFFLGDSKGWRKHIVFANRVVAFADLGLGVLDDALVEVASYILERANPDGNQVFTSRQLDTREKEAGLMADIRSGTGTGYFDQSLVHIIPDYTFAYWAPAQLLQRYKEPTPFSAVIGRVRQGTATADDFRFARLAWEVDALAVGQSKRWPRFSKGGEYSPFVDDIHLVVDWGHDGLQMKEYVCKQYPYLGGNWSFVVKNSERYFIAGASYPRRTASAFAARVLPAGCIFSDLSQTWFAESPDLTLLSVGYFSCRVPQSFVELAVGGGDIVSAGSAARRYTTAVVEGIPAGVLRRISSPENLAALRAIYHFRARGLSTNEASIFFLRCTLSSGSSTLRGKAAEDAHQRLSDAVLALEQSGRFDECVTNEFGLSDAEHEFVKKEIGLHPIVYTGTATTDEVWRLFHLSDEALVAEAVARHGSKRCFTKRSYFVDRRVEIICHLLGISPGGIAAALRGRPLEVGLKELAESVVSESLGVAFGRWDIRYATGEQTAQELPDPFASLPVCPPGQLQNAQGLPARPEDVPASYPVRIAWAGILVDDPNHPLDIERRIHEVVEIIWKDRADAIEREACEILGIKTLRDYFRRATGFFADHVKRYSKSRRQAPIYWPLSTASGSYTLWIYYHCLTDQTLFTCVKDFVDPKLAGVTKDLGRLRTELQKGGGGKQQQELESLIDLEQELREFRDELLRLTKLPYKPNLNDGVMISACPLWKLFRLPKWQKDLKACWEALADGDYDWAHLAYAIWPDRVTEKCKTDRSLAIAHGLEHLCTVEPPRPKAKKKGKKKTPEPTEDVQMEVDL